MQRDLTGKTVIVTGANSGIGRVTALELARRGAWVHLACRSEEKTLPVVEQIRSEGGAATFLPLDLADLASAKQAADAFLATGEPLHLLIANAGLAGSQGLTKDGFELAFGTNHMGHFVFTMRLLDRLRASAPSRIVIVASRAHYDVDGIDWDAVRKPTASRLALREYGVSKLANVLFARALAKRLEGTGVTTYSLHPGVVATDVWRSVPSFLARAMKLFMLSEEEGARTQIHCATDPDAGKTTGLYWDSCKPRQPSKAALDDALAEALFRKSEAWAAPFL
jgi:NAD(P)-dependent dehydrogenase (short-subunit alcohol dehydrogenase family)